MSDTDPATTDQEPHHTEPTAALAPRRGPDLLTLAAGLGALGVASSALLGGVGWLPEVDARWVLAALALVVGLTLVIGSIRHPQP